MICTDRVDLIGETYYAREGDDGRCGVHHHSASVRHGHHCDAGVAGEVFEVDVDGGAPADGAGVVRGDHDVRRRVRGGIGIWSASGVASW